MNTIKRVALLCLFAAACTPLTTSAQTAAADPTPQLAKAASPTPTPAAVSAATPAPPAAEPAANATAPAKAAKTKAAPKGVPPLPPEKAQPVRIPRFDTAPVIDGKMDEAVWKTGAVFKDFYQFHPGDNIAPSQPTEVYIGFDAKTLYMAFRCFDDPTKVRATIPKRDNIFGEDNVRVFLDTFNDQRRAYVLGFNPLGVQADGIHTENQGLDLSVDIVMESKGALTSDGYVVEVAVPFKSLRYEAGKGKQWGIHVWRNIDRNNDELVSWMPMARDASGTLNQAGRITGLEGISTERTLELNPSITFSENGVSAPVFLAGQRALMRAQGIAVPTDSGRFVNRPVVMDAGLTAKFGISPNMTLDLAFNPDFAQVEADATVNTANQRFPIFFEEKRPFFLEGIEIFRTQIAALHTRTIVDPDIAAKLTGKRGRTTYGFLYASDNAPGNLGEGERDFVGATEDLSGVSNPDERERLTAQRGALLRVLDENAKIGILRVKRDIGKENSIGFFGTAYKFADRSNYVGGFDARFRFNKQTTMEVQVLGTNARRCTLKADPKGDDCRTLNGFVYAYNLSQNKRHWFWNINGAGRTPNYIADLGFTRRVNTNNHNLNVGYSSERKPKRKIVSWEIYNYLGGNHDWQGRLQNWTYEGQVGANLQRQTYIRTGYNTGYERVFASEFGATGFSLGRPEVSAHSKNYFAYMGSSPTKRITLNYFFGYRWGQLDYDFGNGRRYPRVSASVFAQREARAAGLCVRQNENDALPPVCLGLLDPGEGALLYTNGGITYKASNALNMSLSWSKNRLVRDDTGEVAFDSQIVSFKTTYQFTRYAFARARLDYSSLRSNYIGQFLFGWTPSPGTAFYVGYNDDMNRGYFNPFDGQPDQGFRRNNRNFFIKASYLFRRSF
ncbi:MAG: carbohydrate binding family 9 domain-containing protein [Acidobacteria bacterium]|nr:carbohydrate binding family 9 domain-containing protein [Acidobacteriota bacterium]